MALSFTVSGLSVLVASVISFVIGWIWYGPLFGKTWMKLNNIDIKSIKAGKQKGMGGKLVLNFIGTLLTAFVLAVILSAVGSAGVIEGIIVAFWTWLGFIAATTLLGSVLWDCKPWGLFVLNGAYWLVVLAVMASIIGGWP